LVYSPVYVYNKLCIIVFVVVGGIGSGVVFNLKRQNQKQKQKKCFAIFMYFVKNKPEK